MRFVFLLALAVTAAFAQNPLPSFMNPGRVGMLTRADTSVVGCTNSGYTGSGPCVRRASPVFTGAVGIGGTPNTYPYVDGWNALEVITNGADSLHLFSVTGYNRAATRHDNYARIVAGDTLYGLADEVMSSYGVRPWNNMAGAGGGFGGSSYAELVVLDESSSALNYPKTHKEWSFGDGATRVNLLYGNYAGLGVGAGFTRVAPPQKMLDVHGSIQASVHVYHNRADTNSGSVSIYSTAAANDWTAGQGVGCDNGTDYCIYGYGDSRVAFSLKKADNQARLYNNLTVGNPNGSGSVILSRKTTSDGNTLYSLTNSVFNWGLGPNGSEDYTLHSYLGGGDAIIVNHTTGKSTFVVPTTANASINLPSGTSPSVCSNGDMWFDGSHFYGCVGGVAKQLDN